MAAAIVALVLSGAMATAATTLTAEDFRLDLSGMGPWEARTAAASEQIAWSSVWATNGLAGANAVVKVHSVKKAKPKYISIDLSGGPSATRYPIECLDEIPGGSWSDEYKTSKLVLRHIPAGSFIMGGRATDYPGAVNTNLHMVTLTKDFYMGVFEVTQRQWELVMGDRPSKFTNETYYATRPVEFISYGDIRGGKRGLLWPDVKDVDDGSFMGTLRRKCGLTAFDLPTEAQWEYACRAGTDTALYTGKNLSDADSAAEVGEIAQYRYNSGWKPSGWTYNETDGTIKVGSYLPNGHGLFDMIGNVAELCLDVFQPFATDAIDPVGPSSSTSTARVYRGGSWSHAASQCNSGCRHIGDVKIASHYRNVGFRLCLHGGEIPEMTGGATLVNAVGEGTATWTPTKAGTYYLTHETQTNGVNGAETLGAWFTVGGPQLAVEPQGELTNGVAIAINGAGDGWTVYYTTDGSEPTSASTPYEGPFSMPDSATVRAVAVSAGGVSSEEATVELTLHPPLAVTGVVARQRWPWNGKVDIDATIEGDPAKVYSVALSARKSAGGEALPIETAWCDGGAKTNGTFALRPGQYRFTWDAAADITDSLDFGEVEFTVSATESVLAGFAKKLTLAVNGYAGAETLTEVPVLVRLSSAIEGFRYADFSDANGGDLVFCDASEKVVYPHEIDEWHTDGESLVWVRLPELKAGAMFKVGYGGAVATAAEATAAGHAVWAGYAGVWHMNEDSGIAYDSTVHGLDALPETGTNKTVDVSSEMIPYANGACGKARQNETSDVNAQKACGNYLLTPSYDALSLGSAFAVSGWFRAEQVVNFPRMIARKDSHAVTNGWEIHPRQNSLTNISVRGSASGGVICPVPNMKESWVSISAVYAGNVFSCYTNGVLSLTGESQPAMDNGLGLAIGCNPPGIENTWCGQYDEIRLRGGLLSADRIKADYDMIADRNFVRSGSVTSAVAANAGVGSTAHAHLDLRTGPRESTGEETLTYSALWDGASGSTVTIAQNGAPFAEGLVGEGEQAWSVNRNGTYTLTHTTYTNGVAGKVETVTFVVSGQFTPDSNTVWYVDATNGVDTADGLSWATAKKTIQAAVDLAVDGNTILVTNGVYGAIATVNKSISIRSVNGAENTIIDGNGSERCFTCGGTSYGLTPGFNPLGYTNSLICGFTLRNGTARFGGGSLEGTVERCVITANNASEQGGGAYGGVLRNCLLVGNAAVSGGGGASKSTLVNCTIAGNTSRINIGGVFQSRIDNCIVVGNQGTQVGTYSESHSSFSSSSYSDAKFVDAAHGDYRLAAGSPCIDAGDSALAPAGTDLAGNPRVMGDAVDMGCYEVQAIPLSGAAITVALEGGPFTYGGTAHEPAAAVTNGTVALVAGRDFSVTYLDNVNAGTARAIVTGVGTYTGSRTNEFTIARRPLAVTAHPQRKTVGDADPQLRWSAPDLVAGDWLTGALVRDAGEAVGSYAIRQGTLAASANYTMTFTGATLEIVPEMAVTAVSFRQRYPWNGLVDVDVTFEGPEGASYAIELIAKDKAGGTNLTVRTVCLDGSTTATNPVAVPAPGAYRLVWDAAADLPSGFRADRVTIFAKLLNPIWSFESIPAIDTSDVWAPETVYHDVQTVVSYGEIENRTPTVRCLTDEWHLEDTLGANVVFSGASMGLRYNTVDTRTLVSLWTWSGSTNRYRMVTLNSATGEVLYDNPAPYLNPGADVRFFSMRDGGGRQFANICRGGYDDFLKSANSDLSNVFMNCRYADDIHGSAVCGYFPNGIPWSDSSSTSISSYDKGANAAVFFSGTPGADLKEAIVLCGGSAGVRDTSTYSCMGNPVGRYIVPLLDGNTFFTVACKGGREFVPQNFRLAVGKFSHIGDWDYILRVEHQPFFEANSNSKGVAMPDGRRIFLGGVGKGTRANNGRIRMWQDSILQDSWVQYPAGHPFESWARRDITCLLPNGKFCGVDEELGLLVVNPLTGEMYVASDDPAFKKGKMGCQLLPNGKVWIIPYDCEGREFEAGLGLCGKLYEVDFGFTRSFSLSSLCSPYLKVAEGDPEPSGIKVGLDPNGGELPGVYAQYYKGANPVYGTLPIPDKSGYTFLGWSKNGTEAGIVGPDDTVPGCGIRLKAVWRAE